jgi:nickel/cobalt exporter
VRRRLLLVAVLAAALFTAMALMAGPVASAHPLGNFTINRYSGLVLSPGRVDVLYVVDMAEIPTFQETEAIDANGDNSLDPGELRAWSARRATEIDGNLVLTVDGQAVRLEVVTHGARPRPGQAGLSVLSLTVRFRGTLDRGSGSVRYSDRNFEGRPGWKEVTVRSGPGVALSSSSVPAASVSGELRGYPEGLLSSPLDVTEATATFHPARDTTAVSAPEQNPAPPAAGASGGSFAALVGRPLTPVVLALSLMLAFGFGAVHALGPGHGKTIAAAYLVGHGARTRQAAAVGAAVALMHTASVLILGLVVFVLSRSLPPERVYPWLTVGTGAVALGLGVGLLLSRVRSGRRHIAAHRHDHSHVHHEDDAGNIGDRPITLRGLLGLAMAGGILPSPTAFVALTGAVAAHRVGYGLALIFAFSLGLAGSLTAVGMLALRAKQVVGRRLASRWMGVLPIASALIIVGFGLFFASKGIAQLS